MGGHLRLVAYGACTLCLFTVCILGPEPWNSSMGLEWKMGSQQFPHSTTLPPRMMHGAK